MHAQLLDLLVIYTELMSQLCLTGRWPMESKPFIWHLSFSRLRPKYVTFYLFPSANPKHTLFFRRYLKTHYFLSAFPVPSNPIMCPGATFSKLLRKILGKDSYLIDDLGKTAILKTSKEKILGKVRKAQTLT